MSYRSRLGKIAKTEKEKYKGKSYEEVAAMMGEDFVCYRPNAHTELFELGKYFEFTKGKINFYDFDIEDETECEFYIMSKEDLKELIYDYHEIIYNFYERLAKGKDDVQAFVDGQAREWCSKFSNPYYLDEETTDGEIVKSWKYEYSIFNLVYIYRTFDWENDYLIYSAW
jgi:hypothetical protein